jgi:hypothetical protein
LNKPIPFGLIDRIVKFRVKDCQERDEAKKRKKAGASAKRPARKPGTGTGSEG